jgi:hypothetical protein
MSFVTEEKNKSLAVQTKEELMKEMPKEVSDKLKTLCILQGRLAELELKKEEIEKVSRVFKTVMIAPVIPPQLRDNNIPDEDDCEVGKIEYEKVLTGSEIIALRESNTVEKLPLRLYNIQTKKIEETEGKNDIKNYAIVSYV